MVLPRDPVQVSCDRAITQTIQCQSYMLAFSFAPSHLDIGHHRPYVGKNQLHPIRQKNDVTFDKWGMAYVPQPSTYPRLFFPFFSCLRVSADCMFAIGAANALDIAILKAFCALSSLAP